MQIRQNVCRTDSIWFLSANARRVAIPCRGRCSTEGFETPLTCRPHKPGMWKEFACGVCWPAQVIGDGVFVNRLYVITSSNTRRSSEEAPSQDCPTGYTEIAFFLRLTD